MKDNARQFVSGGRYRLRLAQSPGDASKEFAEVVIGVME
jgi:hypothetical protein